MENLEGFELEYEEFLRAVAEDDWTSSPEALEKMHNDADNKTKTAPRKGG